MGRAMPPLPHWPPPCRKWKHHLQGPCLLETEGPESPRLPKTPVQETWPVCTHILPGPGVTHCALPVLMWGHSSGSGRGQGGKTRVPPHQEGCCSGGLGSVLGVKWAGTLHLHSIPVCQTEACPQPHSSMDTLCAGASVGCLGASGSLFRSLASPPLPGPHPLRGHAPSSLMHGPTALFSIPNPPWLFLLVSAGGSETLYVCAGNSLGHSQCPGQQG